MTEQIFKDRVKRKMTEQIFKDRVKRKMTEQIFKDRVKRLNDAYDYLTKSGLVMSQRDLALKMGASVSNVSSALTGKETVLTHRFLTRLNHAFINLFLTDWLFFGRGEMLTPLSEQDGIARYDRFKQAFYYIMYHNKFSYHDIAYRMAIAEATLKTICNSGIRQYHIFSNDFFVTFNNAVNNSFNMGWLLVGEGDMLKSNTPDDNATNTSTPKIKYYTNKIMEKGVWQISSISGEQDTEFSLPIIFEDCTYAIHMPDTSMDPTIKMGGIILLSEMKKENLEWGKIYLAVKTDGSGYVRRLFPSSEEDKNKVNLISENQHYPPIEFNLEEDNVRLFLVKGCIYPI